MSKLHDLKKQEKIAGWWDFRKNSLLDQSGNGNDVSTFNGTPSYKNTKLGRGVNCSNTDSLEVTDSASLQLTGGYILVFGEWQNQAGGRLVSKRDAGGTNYDFYLGSNFLGMYDGSNIRTVAADVLGKKMLGVKFNGTSKCVGYLDGVNIGDFSDTSVITTNDANLYIGNLFNNSSGAKNPITQVVILNDSTISDEDIATIYNEYMQERGAMDVAKSGFVANVPKVNDPTLVVHLDGETVNGETMPDLTGRGNNGTFKNLSLETHLPFGSVTRSRGIGAMTLGRANAGDLNLGTEDFTMGGWYYSTAGNTFFAGAYQSYPLFYIRPSSGTSADFRVATDAGTSFTRTVSIRQDSWNHLVMTVDRDGNLTPYVNGVAGTPVDVSSISGSSLSTANELMILAYSVYTNPLSTNGAFKDFRLYKGKALSEAEVKNWYNHYAKMPLYKNDLSDCPPTLANVTAGEIGKSGFKASTGTWKVSEEAIGNQSKKWIECVNAGVAYMPSLPAYGTWVCELNKQDSSSTIVFPIAEVADVFNAATQNGYALYSLNTENLTFAKNVNGSFSGNILMATTNDYIGTAASYLFAITRAYDGSWTVYIKGGAYTNWQKISVSSGSNPATENTFTTSKYMVLDMDAGDKFRMLGIHSGVLTIGQLEAIY